jgi:hypothetical protein
MNFIQLQNRRINLDQMIQYYPTEKVVDILNEKITWYSITFDVNSSHSYELVLCYQADLAARDLDLMTLDFVCVQNKRGNVKELKKVQQS